MSKKLGLKEPDALKQAIEALAKIKAQQAPVVQAKTKAQRILEAKQRRFTLTGRILSGKPINVKVIDNPRDNPACINLANLELTLNEACPATKSAVKALIYDRAKMYHEIDHAEFTDDLDHRHKLASKSKNAQAFLDLSNILEDGRIERCGIEKWNGTKHYLNALLNELAKTMSPSKISGLVLYVRTKLFRNKAEGDYWKPYVSLIDQAIAADSTRVALDNAFEIVEALAKAEPAQPEGEGKGNPKPQGKDKGEGEKTKPEPSKDDSEPEPNKDDNESQDEGEDDSDSGEGESLDSGENEGDSEDEGDGESEQGESQGESEQGDQSGLDSGKDEGQIEDYVQEQIDDIVDEAIDAVTDEAKDEVDEILEEAENNTLGEQEYKDDSEQSTSDELSGLFTSLLVEQNRVKFLQSRQGMLNTLALPSALTTRKCFVTREEQLGAPFVALLLDTSGSMSCRAEALSEASRILHGALQKAKVNVRLIEFGHRAKLLNNVPVEGLICNGASTQTGSAMYLANDWLEEQGATRALMVVVTDGAPDDCYQCEEQKARCESFGGYVLGVRVGFNENAKVYKQSADMQWHDYLNVADVATLPHVLEPKIEAFIAGE